MASRCTVTLVAIVLAACSQPAEDPVVTQDVGADAKSTVPSSPDVPAAPESAPTCQVSSDCVGRITPSGPCEIVLCVPGEGICTTTAVSDGTPCDDGDACTLTDECTGGSCSGAGSPDCDDGNSCTDDGCDASAGCTHQANAAPCDDGDACSQGDLCVAGVCAGAAVSCDDGNPCTDDPCDAVVGCAPVANEAPCDDEDACTLDDTCQEEACAGTKDLICDDGNPCTDDHCDPALGCVGTPNAVACDDGSACTADDVCKDATCAGAAIACDDANPCTDDGCDAAVGCTTAANLAPCDDGNACTLGDACGGGDCTGSAAPACDDGNPCTSDSCAPESGCVFEPNLLPCDDGVECTSGEACGDGICSGGASVCECETNADCATYEDGNLCNGTLACDLSAFPYACTVAPSSVITCGAGGQCDTVECDPTTGDCKASAKPAGTPCDDGDQCTVGDGCEGMACQGPAAADCDDQNPCTGDFCDAAIGCTNPPLQGACDDGDACTWDGTCEQGFCQKGAPLDCNDGNACTDDSCDGGDCVHAPNTMGCDDGSLCTLGDVCSDGLCTFTTVANCEDGNECTLTACDPGTGCVWAGVFGPCAEGAPCQEPGACSGGICLVGAPIDCDDQNPCTLDTCTDEGCSHAPAIAPAPCDDGSDCTVDDACDDSGACAGLPVSCDDGDPCTDDACYAKVGCLSVGNGSCGECSGIGCLPCANGSACAVGGAPIGDTCCAAGDPITWLASTTGYELVDIETDGDYVYSCGGFGMHFSRVKSPASPIYVGGDLPRCQRIALGPTLYDGDQVVYFAHHGDSWVPNPFLATFHRKAFPFETIIEVDKLEGELLYEGMAWKNHHLYVAAHGAGLATFKTAPLTGAPTSKLGVLGGFENAWKIDIDGSFGYVADGAGGLKVVDLSFPGSPSMVTSLATNALARDVDAADNRVFVALGGGGVDVFDTSIPTAPVLIDNIDAMGSAQAVSVSGPWLSVAAWSHLSVYDTQSLTLLGTEDFKLFPEFEQVFGVASDGPVIYVAEWEAVHIAQIESGLAAPDLWVAEELINFGDTSKTKGIIVRNRGTVDLEITGAFATPSEAFSIAPTALNIPPGGAELIEIDLLTPGADVQGKLVLPSNDPDAAQSPMELHLQAGIGFGGVFGVGDSVDSSFGFLDPSGAAQVEGFKGKVVLLAYFALF